MLTKQLLFSLMVVAALCGCAASAPAAPPEGVTPIDPPKALQAFTLTDQNNAQVKLSDLKGKLVVLSFGYTTCPDVCPLTLANYKQVKKKLGDDAAKVAFVFVSVDGEHDTPAVLGKYLRLFDSQFIGLTADDATMRPFALDFYASYQIAPDPKSAAGYTVTHTASWYLVDRAGKLRRRYAPDASVDVITADIRQFLN